MKSIDLRSDTVTLPSPEMRQVMANAEVGDDCYGEDPSVNALQELAAEVTGKDAALYCPSGTMCNSLAHLTHGQPQGEVILGLRHHTYVAECGSAAALAGMSYRTLELKPNGGYNPGELELAIREVDVHNPRTCLIWTENTFNVGGGVVVPMEELSQIRAIADKYGLPVHMDGARVFNAATYLGVSVKEITKYPDSVMFCLSKGLAAPVGSILCGSREFIQEANRKRKLLGGAMRQAGILAAAGIYAIRVMSQRLHEDHENARLLASGLAEIADLRPDPTPVETNMVFFWLASRRFTPEQFTRALKDRGVLVLHFGEGRYRAVTHYGVERTDIERALEIFREVGKV